MAPFVQENKETNNASAEKQRYVDSSQNENKMYSSWWQAIRKQRRQKLFFLSGLTHLEP